VLPDSWATDVLDHLDEYLTTRSPRQQMLRFRVRTVGVKREDAEEGELPAVDRAVVEKRSKRRQEEADRAPEPKPWWWGTHLEFPARFYQRYYEKSRIR
jgi:hypothetical protein